MTGVASAWVSGYEYRMPIEINNTGDNLTYFQYNFTIDTATLVTAGKMQADGSDCYITNATDVLQTFWNESAFNDSNTIIWVNASSLGNASNTTHYMYYGNSSASALMNGTSTFGFFDDFSQGTRFADGYHTDIINTTAPDYGEPTIIAGSTQIDMWYYGGAGNTIEYVNSTDGYTFTDPATTDLPTGLMRPHILKNGTTYYLYVTGNSDTNVYLYTSTNKINFTSQGVVLTISSGWEGNNIGNTFVWVEDGEWYMLYEAKGSVWQIGLANSTDGTTWTKNTSNPTFTHSGAGNPELARLSSEVLKHNGKYYMYYHVMPDVYRAYSTNLTVWTQEGKIGGINKTPSSYHHGDAALAQYNNKTYMWWTPTNQVDTSYLNVVIDDRSYAKMLAISPNYTEYNITDKWIGDTSYGTVSDGTLTYLGDSSWRRMFSKDGATEKTFGPTMAGRFNASISAAGAEIGFAPNPCCNNRTIVYNTGYISHDGASQEITTGEWGYGTKYTFDIKQIGSVSDKYYINDVLNTTHSTNPGSGAVPVEIASYDANVVCDWYFVHTHAATMPTVSVGTETTNAPNITSWQNNKTSNNTLDFTINTSESVNFNATANQSGTWQWDINMSHNYDNITHSWSTTGLKYVSVNITNINGTSSDITWNVTVESSTPPTNLNNFTFTNPAITPTAIRENNPFTVTVDINDSDGIITTAIVKISDNNYTMTNTAGDTWSYTFTATSTPTRYYVQNFYAQDNDSAWNSTTSTLYIDAVSSTGTGSSGGITPVTTPTPTPTPGPTAIPIPFTDTNITEILENVEQSVKAILGLYEDGNYISIFKINTDAQEKIYTKEIYIENPGNCTIVDNASAINKCVPGTDMVTISMPFDPEDAGMFYSTRDYVEISTDSELYYVNVDILVINLYAIFSMETILFSLIIVGAVIYFRNKNGRNGNR